MKIVPNLRFCGQCEQAMKLYEKVFGGRITCLLRYSAAVSQDYDTAGWTEKRLQAVYHGEMMIGEMRFMMCDDYVHDAAPGDRIAMNVTFSDAQAAREAFNIMMTEGAAIVVEPHTTTYSPFMAVIRDPFGIRWGIVTE